MESFPARVAYPDRCLRNRVAVRRRAVREAEHRQIDLEDWIAAAKAREETSTTNA